TTKRQELQLADAAVAAAQAETARVRAERAALATQQRHLRLVAPAAGLVTARWVDPGTTVVAGQAVVEVVDPASLWINVRLDQGSAHGLAAGLSAQVVLRSRSGPALPGRVLRIEPLADAVTEETLAKVVFDALPTPLPPLGELAEVTMALPALAALPVLPNAAVQRVNGQVGVWQYQAGALHFAPVKLGAADLEGRVQVLDGLSAGDQVVVYSEKALGARSRIHIVERIATPVAKAAP
ncbi:MAG: efflux RND transporter periplasmic adaptor subunit, partial [Simplicispira sp.]|nr:efflux RND transporter periplasmic adaptor subunit [Simplicispira sp.]